MTLEPPPKGHAGHAADYVSPDGAEIRLILRPEVEGVRRHSVCEATFHPGQVSRAVRHQHVEESWYGLQGEGDVWRCPPDLNPQSCTAIHVSVGDALVIPTGYSFQVRAAAAAPLRLLCSTAPPWPGPDEAVPVVGGFDRGRSSGPD